MAKELKVEMVETKLGEPAARHSLVDATMLQDEPDDLDWVNEFEEDDPIYEPDDDEDEE